MSSWWPYEQAVPTEPNRMLARSYPLHVVLEAGMLEVGDVVHSPGQAMVVRAELFASETERPSIRGNAVGVPVTSWHTTGEPILELHDMAADRMLKITRKEHVIATLIRLEQS